jgi:thiamine monophosphate synthase
MLHVTIYDANGTQQFMVHRGEQCEDVTEQYEVRALVVDDGQGNLVNGWHIGKRMTPEEVLDAERGEGKEP